MYVAFFLPASSSSEYVGLVKIGDVIPSESDESNYTFLYEQNENIDTVWKGT